MENGNGSGSTGASDDLLVGARRALVSLGDSVGAVLASAPDPEVLASAPQRSHFRPTEEESLLGWFAHFLTVRSGLWEVVEEVSRPVGGRVKGILDETGWRCFVLGYAAACRIVRLDRLLLEEVATESVVQRKLNEGSRPHRIPRKQYTAIFESFTDPSKAHLMEQAMRFANRHRRRLAEMEEDDVVGEIASAIPSWESALDPSRHHYLRRLVSFLGHSFRRRGASTRQQAIFAVLESSGRFASELRDRWTPPRVDDELLRELDAILQPGDVLITRHDHAVTNYFLPGYWPHAALYVGSEADRHRLGVGLDEARAARWSGDRRTLEALKDGVLFRPLEETLAVDAVAVIRPQLGQEELAHALARAAEHEGKLYNFDFDFFRSDRLVCTEVVYRAFDDLGSIRIPLHERSGRPTLSAEDLLDLALAGEGFDPIAVCGPPGCPPGLTVGPDAADAIRTSYR
jgi:hypothetical protein